MVNNGQLVLAWGDLDFDYELIILSIENISGETILKGRCALLSSGNITEEAFTKY